MAKYIKDYNDILRYTGNGIGPELPNQYNMLKILYNIFQNNDNFERFGDYVHYNSKDSRFYFTVSDYDYNSCDIPENGECWISNCLTTPMYILKDTAIVLNSTIDTISRCQKSMLINNSFLYDVHIENYGTNCQIIIADNATLINSKIAISDNVKNTTLIISGYSSIFNTYINIDNNDTDVDVIPSQIQLYNCLIGSNNIDPKILLNRPRVGCDIRPVRLPYLYIRNKPEYKHKPYLFTDTVLGTNFLDVIYNKTANCIGNGYDINEQTKI